MSKEERDHHANQRNPNNPAHRERMNNKSEQQNPNNEKPQQKALLVKEDLEVDRLRVGAWRASFIFNPVSRY